MWPVGRREDNTIDGEQWSPLQREVTGDGKFRLALLSPKHLWAIRGINPRTAENPGLEPSGGIGAGGSVRGCTWQYIT